MSKYRLCFEVVVPMGPGLKYFSNEYKPKAICHPSEVGEEAWAKTENNTDDPWDQYKTLKEWEASDKHYIRNVHLYEIAEDLKEITHE